MGDTEQIATASGTVEAVGLRTTVSPGPDGTRPVVSNGSLRIASNPTRILWRRVLVLPLPADVDIDRVIALAPSAGADRRGDPAFGRDSASDLEVLAVDAFGADPTDIKVAVETRADAPREVGDRSRVARLGTPLCAHRPCMAGEPRCEPLRDA